MVLQNEYTAVPSFLVPQVNCANVNDPSTFCFIDSLMTLIYSGFLEYGILERANAEGEGHCAWIITSL